MKKLKPWQIVLLIIFYPVGIVYFIVWLCRRKKQPAPEKQNVNASTVNAKAVAAASEAKNKAGESMVFVTERGKVFHSVPDCADTFCDLVSEKEARKRGLRPCKKCCNPQYYKFD